MIIKNNDGRLFVIGDHKLLPGCNNINTKEWMNTKKDYNIKDLIEDGKIEEVFEEISVPNEEDKRKKDSKKLVELNEFSVDKRKKILSNTFNLKTLEEWVQLEEDTSLRYLIEKRIDGIKNNKITDIGNYATPKNHV